MIYVIDFNPNLNQEYKMSSIKTLERVGKFHNNDIINCINVIIYYIF